MTQAALTELDASLAAAGGSRRWDAFYADRTKPCVYFGTAPDESVAGWIHDGLLRPGRAVDLGGGNGRNAVLLAHQGISVQAVMSDVRCNASPAPEMTHAHNPCNR